MKFNPDDKRRIYDKTNGKCHLCGKKLAFTNYGQPDSRAAWEVDHSLSKASGGTDHMNNLYPACIDCNRFKGADITARTMRSLTGVSDRNESVAPRVIGATLVGLFMLWAIKKLSEDDSAT